MSLQLENLGVSYGSVRALDGVSLALQPGEMFFLLGPSGCGKSTLLRAVAGFIEQFDGEIRIENQSLKGVPPHKRDFGMVFQNYALFPHLSVAGNVAFGLEARRVEAAERGQRVEAALEMVGLAGYGKRWPGELSGGQQQRVALARALVIRPRVLLLDEPLSNLDARLRFEMREEIRRIHRETHLTTLYVTHDQKEALSLADRMAILNAGKVDALGSPRELYRRPPTRFSAEFLGEVNALEGSVGADGQAVEIGDRGSGFGFRVPLPRDAWSNAGETRNPKPETRVMVFCRPENVRLSLNGEAAASSDGFEPLPMEARVVSAAFLGESTLYEVAFAASPSGTGDNRWRVLRHESGAEALAEGAAVRLSVARQAWSVIPAAGGAK